MSNQKYSNKRITSKDVAKLAGVSQATVSRVISPSSNRKVDSILANKVNNAITELGYVPNMLASSISSGKTDTIGLVIGDQLGPFYYDVLERFIIGLQNSGLQTKIFKIDNEDKISDIIKNLLKYSVDGVIITSSVVTTEFVETVRKNDTPVLLFNRFIQARNINIVYIDSYKSGELAAENFASTGRKRLAYLGSNNSAVDEVNKKNGFFNTANKYGLEVVSKVSIPYSYNDGYDSWMNIVSAKEPDAIFCSSDLIALGAYDAMKLQGIRVPEDVAIIGHDNISMCDWMPYRLSSISQPHEHAINVGIQILLDNMKNKDALPQIRAFKPTLVGRSTH